MAADAEESAARAKRILERCERRAFCEDGEAENDADAAVHIVDALAEATELLRRSVKVVAEGTQIMSSKKKKSKSKRRAARVRAENLMTLANALTLQCRFEEAELVLAEARALASKAQLQRLALTQASAAWNMGAHDDAAEYLLGVLAGDEFDDTSMAEKPILRESEVLLLLGVCLQEQQASNRAQGRAYKGRYEEHAEQIFEDAFSKRRDRRQDVPSVKAWCEAADTWYNLATRCQKENQTQLSIKATLHGLNTEQGQQCPRLWLHLAFVYKSIGDDTNAEQAAATAFHLHPMEARARVALRRWSPESWGSYFDYEHAMVSKVQARVRGHYARKRFRSVIEAQKELRIAACTLSCALWETIGQSVAFRMSRFRRGMTKLAAIWRGARTRASLAHLRARRERERAALRMQCFLRGYFARLQCRAMLADVRRVRDAATTIQRVYRGYAVARQVKRLQRWRRAAIRIEAFVRMLLARARARRLREEKFVRCVVVPLTRLQAIHRRRLVARGCVDSRLQRQRNYDLLRWNSIPDRISRLHSRGKLHSSGATFSPLSKRGKRRCPSPSRSSFSFSHQAHGLISSPDPVASLDAVKHIATNADNLVELGISGAGADPSVSEHIWERVEHGELQSLRTINLQSSASGNSCADARFSRTLFPRLLQASQLSTVRLCAMQLGDASCEAIVVALAGSPRLRRLGLEGNEIGDRGACTLAGLAVSLEELDLRANRIGDNGAQALVAATTRPGSRLSTLHLAENFVTEVGALVIRGAARRGTLHDVTLHSNFVSVRLCHEISQICADALVRSFHRAPDVASYLGHKAERSLPLQGVGGRLCKLVQAEG